MANAPHLYFSSPQDLGRWGLAGLFKGIILYKTSHIAECAHEQRMGTGKAESRYLSPSA